MAVVVTQEPAFLAEQEGLEESVPRLNPWPGGGLLGRRRPTDAAETVPSAEGAQNSIARTEAAGAPGKRLNHTLGEAQFPTILERTSPFVV